MSYLCPPQLSALECGVSLAATNFYEEGQTQKQRNSAGGTYGDVRSGPNQLLRDDLKLRNYEKATKLEKKIPLALTKQLFLLSSVETSGRFFQIFCGLLRKAEL